jgi:hypothetical protein
VEIYSIFQKIKKTSLRQRTPRAGIPWGDADQDGDDDDDDDDFEDNIDEEIYCK